jgi:hypothetical protein
LDNEGFVVDGFCPNDELNPNELDNSLKVDERGGVDADIGDV